MFLHHAAEKTEKWIGGWNIDVVALGPFFFLAFLASAFAADPDAIAAGLAALIASSPIWLPIGLLGAFWAVWIHYVRFDFFFKTKYALLKIELPQEVEKSPVAMEIFFKSLWNTGGETTFLNRWWEGKARPIWSLEIASNEGRINYYIHLRAIMRDVVEAKLYGQYPGAKITLVDDYVDKVPFNLEEYDMWCGEYTKTNKTKDGRPADAVPIQTYVDYALDKDTDTPETKTDPISNLIELLGSRGPGEYLWVQIIMRAHAKRENHGFLGPADDFKDPGEQKIKEIIEEAVKRAQSLVKDEAEAKKVGARGATLLSPGEKDLVEAIERQMDKLVFQCGIRCLYIGKKEVYRGITGASTFRLFDSFRNGNNNELRGTRGMVGFDYPWEDFMNIRKNHLKKLFFFHYKHRAYFYVPYDQVPVHLTTEELASLWHFPGSAVQTPTLERVPNRVLDAPSNIPTGAPQNLPN